MRDQITDYEISLQVRVNRYDMWATPERKQFIPALIAGIGSAVSTAAPVLGGIGALATGIGALSGSRTSGQGFQTIPLTEEQKLAQQFLLDLMLGGPEMRPTRGVAELSDLEQQGIDIIKSYIGAEPDPAVKEIREELLATARGERGAMDITQLPGFESIVGKITSETFPLARQLQIRGMGKSSPGAKVLGKHIAGELAPYSRAARQEQMQSLGALMDLIMNPLALKKAQLAMTTGTVPRGIEQQKHEAAYESALMPQQIASLILGTPTQMYQPGTTGPNPWTQAGSAIETILPGIQQIGGYFKKTPMDIANQWIMQPEPIAW